jgi:hypothetical protein
MARVAGALAGLAALALAACNPAGDVGYVEIKTMPVAPVTQTPLYIDTTKLDPIKKGSAVLRQQVGTRKLSADGLGGQLAPLCDIVVKKNRITTVTVSVLERPPRCQCRFSGGADTPSGHACVS